jgi:glycyl-tRNA synthetase alpha chain
VDWIYEIAWARDPQSGAVVKYGDVRLADELQFSVYNFERADVDNTWKHFELCESECKALLEEYSALKQDKRRFPLLAAYDLCLKCSHLFNILDARGAISVTERVGVIARVRALAVGIAKAWVDQQKREAEGNESSEVQAGGAKLEDGELSKALSS